MKEQLTELIYQTLKGVAKEYGFDVSQNQIVISPTKHKEHGDYACNIALVLAKQAKMPPRKLAEIIASHIDSQGIVKEIQIAGPGFINFFLNESAQFNILETILSDQKSFGATHSGDGRSINIEYVSANPTGPLHVGHGRGAAIGSALVNIYKKAGFNVTSEYYVNDAGRQMDILTVSIWLRYLMLGHRPVIFPDNGYKGDYIIDIAKHLQHLHGSRFDHDIQAVMTEYNQLDDQEKSIDYLIKQAKDILGQAYSDIHQCGLKWILDDIQSDLSDFNVEFDNWFSEKSLLDVDAINKAIAYLKEHGFIYEKNKALWFRSTQFNDEKDRCIVRDNGLSTYFASDAAYLLNKFERGYDEVVYLFGADHHGYIARLLALAKAFGYDTSKVHIPLVQFASLYRHGQPVQMSTRSGSFVTLRKLREEVGTDAARFFYIMRKPDQHLDFDLDLATSKTNENPVFYIQYAHARICSVFKQLSLKDMPYDQVAGLDHRHLLNKPIEADIANKLAQYPTVIDSAAIKMEPHLLANYLKELANLLHSYYNSYKFIIDDYVLMQARLTLLLAVKHTLVSALDVLGISSPETM